MDFPLSVDRLSFGGSSMNRSPKMRRDLGDRESSHSPQQSVSLEKYQFLLQRNEELRKEVLSTKSSLTDIISELIAAGSKVIVVLYILPIYWATSYSLSH